jgi:branched-chain amino acid transport system ATP-binding protein
MFSAINESSRRTSVPDAGVGSGLEIAGLVASYGEMDPVVRGVDLVAACGHITAIIGPNGSGKSSLLKALCGMMNRHGGQVSLNGRDVSKLTPRSFAREGIRYMPQGNAIFPGLTVKDNLRLAGWASHVDGKAFDSVLETLQSSFPMLRTKQQARAAWLSGGEQRQLEFARTLMGDPQLILLDEPSAGLSPLMTAELYPAIAELRGPQRVILLVDQNVPKALEIADVVYELRGGVVAQTFASDTADAEGVIRGWLQAGDPTVDERTAI